MAVMGGGLAAAAAFVDVAENEGDDTGEKFPPDFPRAAIRSIGSENEDTSRSLGRRVILLLDVYIWEPVCTGFRFLQLLVIFVPVILTVPAIWVGARIPERDNERPGTLWWYGFLVQAMEWAGPAFIKLGQWAASRTDIFPNELCDIMSKLHANAPAHSLHATKRIVCEAFGGRDFDDIFDEFDEKPLGVGAIAQVYKAKLKPDLALPGDIDLLKGPTDLRQSVRKKVKTALKSIPKRVPSSYVAVKVQHPRVERIVRRDLRIMRFFASVLNAIPTIEWLSLPDEVDQFGEMMKLQLDLRIEASNLSRFRKNFKDRTTAWFPFPYTEFCTRSVLIEEFAHGIPLADFIANGGGVFQQDIASEGLDAFLRMLLLDNFVHADLHPGNIMVRFYEADKPSLRLRRAPEDPGAGQQADVTEQILSRLRPYRHDKQLWNTELGKIDREGFRPQLIFIDTGLVTELNDTNRRNFLDLFRAVAEFDGYKAGHLMCERCRQPDAVLDEEVFALKMEHLVLSVKSRTLALGNVKIGDILQQVLGMVRQHHVRLEGDFVNVVISILLLEGIGRSLDPDVDLLSSSLPILRQLGTQGGKDMVKEGDFSVLMVWLGLETRRFMQASAEDPGCPMHKATVDAFTPPSPPSSPVRSSCPVPHGNPAANAALSSGTVSHNSNNAPPEKPQEPSMLSKLNPLNYMFHSISQERAPEQTHVLPTSRDESSIPKGSGDGNWEYPSPQQMYNALLRKGYTDTDVTAVESMVAVHNFLNEGAWGEIVDWERRFGKGLSRGWEVSRRGEENAAIELRRLEAQEGGQKQPTLVRFQGRPKEMTPKAAMLQVLGKIYPSKFGTEPPFDRHDWYVSRGADGQKKEVRYVIDFYSAPPEPTGEPVFYLDVRPAMTPTGAVERLMRWGGDVWFRASGAQVRESNNQGQQK
ncbi:hypothetical protein C8A05DRAFT_42664 [Staphylotrichum tortipilum]|uniref:holocytochrome-c synthase n=1 Tax=Staphylotrichum tortipilum TaxID=2831512 RepID=A0AAN6MNK8_9PEZI|nr:hypothetical protein C8A05DRAFT_42664 [Staphylotrichum longicolle]